MTSDLSSMVTDRLNSSAGKSWVMKQRIQKSKVRKSLTAVEFSAEFPYGKAVALLDLKSGLVKVNEECFAMPAIVLAFIISNTLKKEGHNTLPPSEEIDSTTAKTGMSSVQRR